MEQSLHGARLIGNKGSAVVALSLTGIVAALGFRQFVFHPHSKSYWLLDFRGTLPVPAATAIEVAFYGYLLWLGTAFYRAANRRERVLVAGWFLPIFLGPVRSMVSMPVATAITYARAFCTLVALLAAVDIFLRVFSTNDSDARNPVSSK